MGIDARTGRWPRLVVGAAASAAALTVGLPGMALAAPAVPSAAPSVQAAAPFADAAQRARTTWETHGRPAALVVVRPTSVDLVDQGRLTRRVPRTAGTLTLAGLDRYLPQGWLSITRWVRSASGRPSGNGTASVPQVIKRGGEVFIWSRGEDLMTERFPEIERAARELPDGTVLDGEILPWRDGRVLPFLELQRRIGRKNLSTKILSELPVILQCYDLLEFEGRDIRTVDFRTRREMLGALVDSLSDSGRQIFKITEAVEATTWQQLADKCELSRSLGVEGFMLKHRASPIASADTAAIGGSGR